MATTEEFMRALFGRIISICPDAQEKSAEKQIHLGSAIWHGPRVLTRGAFENASLTGKGNIVKTAREFLGYNIDKTDRVWGVLDEYDKVCELRHGIVHSGVTMPGKNAVKLKLTPAGASPRLSIGFAEIQECAEVCTSVAVSLNLDFFEEIGVRWATSWRQYNSWRDDEENTRFKEIWRTFYSKFDDDRSLIASPKTMIKCRNAIKREFL